jgi:hypothetical protein
MIIAVLVAVPLHPRRDRRVRPRLVDRPPSRSGLRTPLSPDYLFALELKLFPVPGRPITVTIGTAARELSL